MNLSSIAVFTIAFLASVASAFGEPVMPKNAKPFSVRCSFHQSCFSGQKCTDEDSEVTIVLENQGSLATITRPNGSVVLGPVMTATKFGAAEYTMIMSSDGSGASHFTIFPDFSVIWTSHLTLAKNISYSHFGFCEDMT